MSELRHLGVIIDGNRRYSKRHNLSFEEVYELGAKKVYEVIRFVFQETSIPELSIYALSYDNLLRKSVELDTILKVQKEEFDRWASDPFFQENGIAIKFSGELEILPKEILQSCVNVMQKTSQNNKKTLNILIAYFGNKEIIRAVEKILKGRQLNENNDANPDVEQLIKENLSVKTPVDLIIRTGGGGRLSGFLPWQSDYAELYKLDKLWPEIELQDVKDAIAYYDKLEQKHGK